MDYFCPIMSWQKIKFALNMTGYQRKILNTWYSKFQSVFVRLKGQFLNQYSLIYQYWPIEKKFQLEEFNFEKRSRNFVIFSHRQKIHNKEKVKQKLSSGHKLYKTQNHNMMTSGEYSYVQRLTQRKILFVTAATYFIDKGKEIYFLQWLYTHI